MSMIEKLRAELSGDCKQWGRPLAEAIIEVADRLAKFEAIAAASGAKVPEPAPSYYRVVYRAKPHGKVNDLYLQNTTHDNPPPIGPLATAAMWEAPFLETVKQVATIMRLPPTFHHFPAEVEPVFIDVTKPQKPAETWRPPVHFAPAVANHADTKIVFRGCRVLLETTDKRKLATFVRFLEREMERRNENLGGPTRLLTPAQIEAEVDLDEAEQEAQRLKRATAADHNIGLAEGETICPNCRGIPPEPCWTCHNKGRVKVIDWSKDESGKQIPVSWEPV